VHPLPIKGEGTTQGDDDGEGGLHSTPKSAIIESHLRVPLDTHARCQQERWILWHR